MLLMGASQVPAKIDKKRTALLDELDLLSAHLSTTFPALSSALGSLVPASQRHVKTHVMIVIGPTITTPKARILCEIDGLEVLRVEECKEDEEDNEEEDESDSSEGDDEIAEDEEEDDHADARDGQVDVEAPPPCDAGGEGSADDGADAPGHRPHGTHEGEVLA